MAIHCFTELNGNQESEKEILPLACNFEFGKHHIVKTIVNFSD